MRLKTLMFSLVLAFSCQRDLLSANICQESMRLRCSATVNKIEFFDSPSAPIPRDTRNLFGIHTLWWEHRDKKRPAEPALLPKPVLRILQTHNVGFIRYGGGANEIDWRGCVGTADERFPQKVVDWTGPLRCLFGIHEYECANDFLHLPNSWYIANLVGFEGNIRPVPAMAELAKGQARYVRKRAASRARYWELGNELERGHLKWQAATIAERSSAVGKAILSEDPGATLVMPLIEYKPNWIQSDIQHNRELIRAGKDYVSNYALHVYYDNPPSGPSVSNRLRYIEALSGLLAAEGIKEPAIWITEHARWPAGSPNDPDWRKHWGQTGNHDAVLATADFLIGLAQIPAVKGAVWHGLRAGPWNFIEFAGDTTFPSLIAELYKFLNRETATYIPLSTVTTTTGDSKVLGGYSIRAAAFRSTSGPANGETVIWIVNRSRNENEIEVARRGSKVSGAIDARFENMTEPQEWPDPVASARYRLEDMVLTMKDGAAFVRVPPRSVSVLRLARE